MAEWGSGSFTPGVYDKVIPGAYVIISVAPNGNYTVAERGYAAAMMELPGGEDNAIIALTKEQFEKNSEKYFGVPYDDDSMLPLRELFSKAHTAYVYRLNSGGHKATGAAGTAKYSGTVGNNISVTVSRNADQEATFDVDTFYNGDKKDSQNVPEKAVEEIKLTKGTEKPGTAVETADATFTFDKNKITVQFSNVPEGHKPSIRVKGQVGGILAFMPGRMEDTSLSNGNKHIISYYPGAAINGEMTVEAVLTKDKVTVLKSCTYTCEKITTDTGADGSKLIDNDYVVFDKSAILLETGGDVFSGGTVGSIKGSNYAEAKDLFEAYHFNTLALPTTDKQTQDMFVEYTKHMRDEEGVKFQLVIPHSPERNDSINYEGVIEYSPINTVTDEKYKDNGLTFWLAGAEAACPVQSNLTGLVYDGEFEVEAKVTRVQQRSSIMGGQVLFNKMGDSVVLLRDINTLTSVEEGSTSKSDDFKKNQTIRVLDGLVQETADCFNNFFVRQHLANTEVNRAELRNQLIKIRQRYATIGAINGYDESLMQIEPGEKLSDVIGNDGVSVSGAMEFLYFSLRLVQETV